MKAFIVLLLVSLADLSQQEEWSYADESKWPGICTTGQQQSPIDINTQEAVLDENHVFMRGPLQFTGFDAVPVTAVNNGHTLQWTALTHSPAPVLSGGPIRGHYTFVQLHFHWLSEHAFDGVKYPMEIHFLFIKNGLTMEEALLRPDGLAVVGVMAKLSYEVNSDRGLDEIMPLVPYLMNSSQNETIPHYINATRLLSPEIQSYYTYHGSLTTPYCNEVVTWIVMDKPIPITSKQYKTFKSVNVGSRYINRSLQPVNRMVYRSSPPCSFLIAPTITGTLANIARCLSSTVRS